MRGFLVEQVTPGFTAPQMHGKWGLPASITPELVLEGVSVSEHLKSAVFSPVNH
jgi:glutaryl-CoA dehydrogenase